MKNDQPEDLDARIKLAVAAALAAKEAKPVPSDHLPVSKPWPKLGPHLDAALEAATDSYESNHDLAAAVAQIYAGDRRDPALAADLRAWRHDDKGSRHDWAETIIERGFVTNLIESRHRDRETKRGRVVSALPDSALPLIFGRARGK